MCFVPVFFGFSVCQRVVICFVRWYRHHNMTNKTTSGHQTHANNACVHLQLPMETMTQKKIDARDIHEHEPKPLKSNAPHQRRAMHACKTHRGVKHERSEALTTHEKQWRSTDQKWFLSKRSMSPSLSRRGTRNAWTWQYNEETDSENTTESKSVKRNCGLVISFRVERVVAWCVRKLMGVVVMNTQRKTKDVSKNMKVCLVHGVLASLLHNIRVFSSCKQLLKLLCETALCDCAHSRKSTNKCTLKGSQGGVNVKGSVPSKMAHSTLPRPWTC